MLLTVPTVIGSGMKGAMPGFRQVSGLGARGLLTLARVPGFLVWKILLSGRSKPTEWVRTDRESR